MQRLRCNTHIQRRLEISRLLICGAYEPVELVDTRPTAPVRQPSGSTVTACNLLISGSSLRQVRFEELGKVSILLILSLKLHDGLLGIDISTRQMLGSRCLLGSRTKPECWLWILSV